MPSEPRSPTTKAELDRLASRIATIGIIAGLACTSLGMLARSPVFGGAGLLVVLIAVVLRRPLARLVAGRG
ncbi:hypothetical protein [Prosthecomicrobium pneumaticum]|uniref:Putative membrane protein n=1 Tax=Prosthecomicrobium pneumaticum TaxID=81895 RepID=A0A7W9FP16_9HYPH|nr:hypothetical protein [Prosthecomicrobium pneumaticum]MBB5754170.1 putative membrane protein [Prosthecomicrobium pneumaticum]